MQENFEIPIIFLSKKEEADKVIKCFNDFNVEREGQDGRSLCSIEINAFMSAAGNSEICMRRTDTFKLLNQVHFCDPLQSKNVYGTLFPREVVVDNSSRLADANEKIILVTARLDTTSNFDGLGLGAMDSLESMATLLTVGHFLRKIVPKDKHKFNVMFVLFNGESFDYIGSQRFVYDLKNGDAFPSPTTNTKLLNLDNIELLIDIGSLDLLDDLAIFNLGESAPANTYASKFLNSVEKYKRILNLDLELSNVATSNIPPVSAQSFLREKSSFPALVISTKAPHNKFYHSVFDNIGNLNFSYHNTSKDFDELFVVGSHSDFANSSVQARIQSVASLIALGIYDLISDDLYSRKEIASALLVDELLYCFLVASRCRLFESVHEFPKGYVGNDIPPNRYIGVRAHEAPVWAYHTMGFVLSEKVEFAKENCSTLPHSWIPGVNKTGECRLTTQNLSLALSPAFEEDNYDFKSNKYSTWTESTWNDFSARIFLQPSATHESMTFVTGLSMLIVSFIIVYFVKSRSDVLFGDVAVEQ